MTKRKDPARGGAREEGREGYGEKANPRAANRSGAQAGAGEVGER